MTDEFFELFLVNIVSYYSMTTNTFVLSFHKNSIVFFHEFLLANFIWSHKRQPKPSIEDIVDRYHNRKGNLLTAMNCENL